MDKKIFITARIDLAKMHSSSIIKIPAKERNIRKCWKELKLFYKTTQKAIRTLDTFSTNPLLSIILPTIKDNLKEYPIDLSLLIETALLLTDYNEDINFIINCFNKYKQEIEYNELSSKTFNYITSTDGSKLLENLRNIFSIYNNNKHLNNWEELNNFPLLTNINFSGLSWQKIHINDEVYKLRLKDFDIPNTLCFSPEECINIYKSHNNSDSHPYKTLYTEMSNKKNLDNIIFNIIEEKKDAIIIELSKPKNKKGRPNGDLNFPFKTDNLEYQKQYTAELQKLCKGKIGKNLKLIMIAANDVEIFRKVPSFKAAEYNLGNIGHQSAYNKWKKVDAEKEEDYIYLKNKLKNIKFKIENN